MIRVYPNRLAVLQASFFYKGRLLEWRKPGLGTGLTTRKRYESMWYGTRDRKGGLPFRCKRDQEIVEEEDLPLVIEAPRRKPHSRKPDKAYAALEQLFGDVRRIDIFGRFPHPGWATWGNEVRTLLEE